MQRKRRLPLPARNGASESLQFLRSYSIQVEQDAERRKDEHGRYENGLFPLIEIVAFRAVDRADCCGDVEKGNQDHVGHDGRLSSIGESAIRIALISQRVEVLSSAEELDDADHGCQSGRIDEPIMIVGKVGTNESDKAECRPTRLPIVESYTLGSRVFAIQAKAQSMLFFPFLFGLKSAAFHANLSVWRKFRLHEPKRGFVGIRFNRACDNSVFAKIDAHFKDAHGCSLGLMCRMKRTSSSFESNIKDLFQLFSQVWRSESEWMYRFAR